MVPSVCRLWAAIQAKSLLLKWDDQIVNLQHSLITNDNWGAEHQSLFYWISAVAAHHRPPPSISDLATWQGFPGGHTQELLTAKTQKACFKRVSRNATFLPANTPTPSKTFRGKLPLPFFAELGVFWLRGSTEQMFWRCDFFDANYIWLT